MTDTEKYDYTTVWAGQPGLYLTALNGIEPFATREMTGSNLPDKGHWQMPTGKLIVKVLSERGPLTQTQLASACNRAYGEVTRSLRRLAAKGAVFLEQPCLLAIAPKAGQLWRVRGPKDSWGISTSALALKTLRANEGPMTRAELAGACGRLYTDVSRAVDWHVKHGRMVAVDGLTKTAGRPAQSYRVV